MITNKTEKTGSVMTSRGLMTKKQDKDENEKEDKQVSNDGEQDKEENEIDKQGSVDDDEQGSGDEEEDEDGSEDEFFPQDVRDFFMFDSMHPSIRKYRKSFIECVVASEDHGIELKDYNPRMFYPTHVMSEKFWNHWNRKEFTMESHLLRVTEKPCMIKGLLGPNASVACIIDYLFQQWEYYTGFCFDRFEDLIDDTDEFQRFLYAIDLFIEDGMDRVYEVFVGNPKYITLTHEYDGDFFDDEVCDEINHEVFSSVICNESDFEDTVIKKITKLQDYITLKNLITSSLNGLDEEQGKFFISNIFVTTCCYII